MRSFALFACLLLTTLAAAQRGICLDQDGKAYPKGCPDTPTLRVQTSAASTKSQNADYGQCYVGDVLRRKQAREVIFRLVGLIVTLPLGCFLIYYSDRWLGQLVGVFCLCVGFGLGLSPIYYQRCEDNSGQRGSQPVLCEPVMDGDKWTPHVKNCKLQEGATIDDAINGMTDMREMERKQWAREREILITGLDKGIKAATLYKQAYEKCSSTSSHASIERHDH